MQLMPCPYNKWCYILVQVGSCTEIDHVFFSHHFYSLQLNSEEVLPSATSAKLVVWTRPCSRRCQYHVMIFDDVIIWWLMIDVMTFAWWLIMVCDWCCIFCMVWRTYFGWSYFKMLKWLMLLILHMHACSDWWHFLLTGRWRSNQGNVKSAADIIDAIFVFLTPVEVLFWRRLNRGGV